MRWVYVAIGILAFFYLGQAIEHLISGVQYTGEVQVLKAGAQP